MSSKNTEHEYCDSCCIDKDPEILDDFGRTVTAAGVLDLPTHDVMTVSNTVGLDTEEQDRDDAFIMGLFSGIDAAEVLDSPTQNAMPVSDTVGTDAWEQNPDILEEFRKETDAVGLPDSPSQDATTASTIVGTEAEEQDPEEDEQDLWAAEELGLWLSTAR